MLLLEIMKNQNLLNTIHFVGIGGIGMSGIAEIMHNLGYKIQGSDLSENSNTKRLLEKGVKIIQGHDAANIENASYVVISSAIKESNPELVASKEKQIPIITRAEMLAELMRLKCSIAISGSHGKTTTTSLVACLFEAADLDPTVINGGIINNKSTNAYLGAGDYLIAEADESDATFIKIPSTIGVITNIDPEHMDYYNNFESLIGAFEDFLGNLPFYGFGVACIDHPVVRDIVSRFTKRRVISYGIDSEDANIRAFNIKSDISSSTFDIKIQLPNSSSSAVIDNITIPIPGKHNVLNSLAALAIAVELGFGLKVIKDGFKNFQGVKRRFTKVCEYNGAEVIDDYAHHPVEINATLAAARSIANAKNSRVIAVFQPHRYSRLKDLFDDFSASFKDADMVYIMDVFAAGEEKIEDYDAKKLVAKISSLGSKANYLASEDNMKDLVADNAKQGDLFIMMGAGSISKWANELTEKLEIRE